jgi:tRNA1Val (adenine37-N6)-methyltransferase
LQETALSHYPDENLRVLELGSGCGIVSIMLALQRPEWSIEAIEIQPELHRLAVENGSRCRVRVRWQEADLRTFQASEPFDLIISNPPWLKAAGGRPSPNSAREFSRRELLCTMEDVFACVKRNLAPKGEALLLYPASRLDGMADTAAKTFLDIFDVLPPDGLKDQIICRIRHKG